MEGNFDDEMNTRLKNKGPIAHPAFWLACSSEQKLLSFCSKNQGTPWFLIYNLETIKLEI